MDRNQRRNELRKSWMRGQLVKLGALNDTLIRVNDVFMWHSIFGHPRVYSLFRRLDERPYITDLGRLPAHIEREVMDFINSKKGEVS